MVSERWQKTRPIDVQYERERRRVIYEFDVDTVGLALLRANHRCEHCGRTKKALRRADESDMFEIHHILWIEHAFRFYPNLRPETVGSLMNAQVLCCKCHQEIHKKGLSEDQITALAEHLIEFQQRIDENRLQWFLSSFQKVRV